MINYSQPDSLIETQWLSAHMNDSFMRIIEVDMSPESCKNTHIPGAVFWSIPSELMNPDRSMNLDSEVLSALLSKSGISPETTVVAYGSNLATSASIFWLLKRFGHEKVHVLNGGHQKWMEEGRPVTSVLSNFESVHRRKIVEGANFRPVFRSSTRRQRVSRPRRSWTASSRPPSTPRAAP